MRTLGEIRHPECKISLFSWNGKYLVKFEQGLFEQTYKFEHLEFENETEFRSHLTSEFIDRVAANFRQMAAIRGS
ncbi:MAG TPA: hypothetical protein VM432_00425 [Bdellovibrionales bacterium]|nr:hypothetical protein [Bdellovibrionales bacterium]